MSTILSFVITFAIVIIVLKLIALPIKIIGRLAINAIIGGVILFLIAKIGIAIVITWWTAALVAVLGIPGVIIVVILSFIL